MRSNSLLSQLVSFVVSALILLGGGIGFWLLVYEPEQQASATVPPPPPLVKTKSIQPHHGSLDIVVDGVVAPFREISVAAEVAGRIIYKNEACNSGRFVKQGTPLIRVDPRDYELEIRRLRNEYEQAEANQQELAVEIGNTKESIKLAEEKVAIEAKEVARLEGLVDDRVVTDSELDRAKQVELTARNSLLELKNQLNLLTTRQRRLESATQLVATQQERAQLDLQRTEIMAPVDGVVVQDLVEQDSYVQKGAALFTIEDTSAVEVKCRLRMDELHWLWRRADANWESESDSIEADYEIPPAPVTVTYQLTGRDDVRYQWEGKLDRYDGIGVDEATRTVPCRVVVDKPRQVKVQYDAERPSRAPPALVRGMFVSIAIHVEKPGALFLVPEPAVRPGESVWVVRGKRVASIESLQVIERIKRDGEDGKRQTYLLVQADGGALQLDDRVVVPPFGAVRDGDEVRVSETK